MTRSLHDPDSLENPLPDSEVESAVDWSEKPTPPISASTDDLSSRTEAAMTGNTLSRTVQINNPLGFHMRPKMGFAKLASRFESMVKVTWQGHTGNGKSMWDLMLVAAEQGHVITVEVSGPDARQALDALVEVLAAPSMGEDSELGLADNI